MTAKESRTQKQATRAVVGALLTAALAVVLPVSAGADPERVPAAEKAPVTGPGGQYNGPEKCSPIAEDGTVRALKPGECAQFGTVGQKRTENHARNVILIIGDGMGQQEITAARNYLKGAAGRFEGLDAFTSTGAYTHHSVDRDGSFNYVTDSAASATSWTTGIKTYNGAIGVDLEQKPVENLLEKAKKAGLRTGNVSTSEIEDATPAAFVAHAFNRKCYGPQEEENSKVCQGEAFAAQYRHNGGLGSIAEQIVDARPDLTLGGGLAAFDQEVIHEGEGTSPFLPARTTWTAGKTVLDNAADNGFTVVRTAAELDSVTAADQDAPVLGLFDDGNMITRYAPSKATPDGGSGRPLECEAQDTEGQPELVDMTTKAIELLDDPESDKGFLLQVESASIDKRSHAADACGMIGEVERLDETVKAALDFAKKDGDTLVVVTADHAHSTEIIYDGQDSVAATTRLRTGEGSSQTIAYGSLPLQELADNPKASQQHNGSQLRVAAYGPGEENVIGQTDQTDLFFTVANALRINDVPTIEASDPTEKSATSYRAGTEDRNAPADPLATCYKVGDDGFVSGPGDCAQFAKEGQGLDDEKAKNVILFIGDGMGDSEITSARNYLHGANGRLPGIDALPYTGYYTTFALDPELGGPTYVTDSAASATGWATGTKTYNGGLGIRVDGTPVPNIIEMAKARGLKTGNVTTAEIQDATPAAVGSHALNRKCYGPEYDKNNKTCQGEGFEKQFREYGGLGSISEQLIDTRADITLGGGAKYLEQTVQTGGDWDGHTWTKGDSVLDNARNQGFTVVTSADELDAVKEADQDAPVLGIFAEGNLPRVWEQSIPTVEPAVGQGVRCTENPERGDEVPTLAQMTTKALDLLRNDNGFLVQIESASVDKADHDADICGQIGEAQQLDDAIRAARDWVRESGEPTLIITTADHAHTSQITSNDRATAGRTTKLVTADGDEMTVNYATAKSNDDEEALGSQTHTGAQLRVAAEGPGAANVVGQIDQTDIHYVIANALDLDTDGAGINLAGRWEATETGSPDTSTEAQETSGTPTSSSTKMWIALGFLALVILIAVTAFVTGRRRTNARG
ncbi:alkaline phosphatase [Corynebacterium sp. CCM 8835]|uniref:Alkaline phosphatase n=1 Tax=Corynebacterium antarcticum TaxID=2800405 RepID=A0ABS1FIV6_9CORY|nr:alkaline phosphatase [Corynebacterium antarcticum]MCK7643305.1 alkaline phosphatase [Corynebacterium antarcticum]MCL0246533.1 alkaline phosphatase [Corynebacterium antarcticum]